MMVPKTYRDPESETLVTFAFASLGGALAAGAVGAVDVSLLLYPVYYCVINGAIALLIWERRVYVSACSGSTARTSVPSPGGLSTLSEPSQAPTRSASPLSPEPAPACAPPTPSSRTSTTSDSPPLASFTVAWLALAYLATLVSASETVK